MRKVGPIITPLEFKEEMKKIVLEFPQDEIAAHIKMDTLMTAVLASMGYQDGIEVYNSMKKHYE